MTRKHIKDWKRFNEEVDIDFDTDTPGQPPRLIMRYSAFDWDDNILFMPTKIHMEKLEGGNWNRVDISTEKFAEVRQLPDWRTTKDSFIEFGDVGKRGSSAFLDDVKQAIKNKSFGPSWNDFIKCLKKGNIFAIITARAHEPSSVRKAVEWIIKNILTRQDRKTIDENLQGYMALFFNREEQERWESKNIFQYWMDIMPGSIIKSYLDKCEFIGVSSPSFVKNHGGSASSPEKGKTIAMNNFLKKIDRYSKIINGVAKMGFSDDDIHNVEKMGKFFNEISPEYKNISLNIFDTSNKELKLYKTEKNI